MSLPKKIHHTWTLLGLGAASIWDLHHKQMEANARYARTVIQGVIRALWQDSIERFLAVLIGVSIQLIRIPREDGSNPRQAYDA